MGEQVTETGLSPVRIENEDTFVYCKECGGQIPVHIQGTCEMSPLRDKDGNPVCEGCAIEH